MTRTVPDRQRRTGPATERAGPADAITRVLSRQVKTGHEQAFEAVLRGLAAEVSCQPGHLDATVLKPPPGRPAQLHDRVLSCPLPGRRRVAFQQDPGPAGRRSKGALRGCPQAQHLSGLEGRLAAPGAPVLVPPARGRPRWSPRSGSCRCRKLAGYCVAPRLSPLPVGARPLVFVLIVIPVTQYAVMPLLTRAARPFLYPALAREPRGGGS
jgi:uncharacterized protein